MGELVGGRFELLELAGQGGFGEVWRAHDRATGRTVALKRPTIVGAPRLRARFDAEVAILARTAHPAIVEHVAHGEDDGHPWVAMEWVDGGSLEAYLAKGPMVPEVALALAERLAEGIGELHAKGIVHRDLKPANVLLEGGDARRPKLVDLGIAQAGDQLTGPGEIIGTPGYLAPEQASGGEIDSRADVFSLGVILYEGLTGVSPFMAEHPVASLTKTLLEDPPAPSRHGARVSPALEALLAAMMAKDPERRPSDGQGAAHLLRSLADAPSAIAVEAPRVGAGERQLVSLLVGEHWRDREGDTLDQEAVAALRGTLNEVAARFGATLVMASGASFAITVPRGRVGTDGPRRAVRCALALSRALPEHRLAVATARAGAEGAIGETIERAARLVPRDAALARIAVDAVTAALLDGRFVLEATDGGAQVVRELAGPPRPRARAPLVGRDGELTALRRRFERVVGEARPAVAVVRAEAGLGKSRLAGELLPTLSPPPRIGWIAAHPTSTASPFAVARGLVAQALGVPPKPTVEALTRALGALDGELAFLPDLFTPAGRGDVDPALHAARVRGAATAAIDAVARRDPVLLVVDDAQHADAPTLDWLDALSRPRDGARVFVLALATADLA